MDNIPVKAVKEFLHQQGYNWKGEIHACGNPTHTASPFENNNQLIVNAVIHNPNPYNQYILVNLCELYFCSPIDDENMSAQRKDFTLTKNFSTQWRQFMLDKYGTDYQQALTELADQNIKTLLKSLQANLQALKTEHKTKFEGVYDQINFWKSVKSSTQKQDTILKK